MFHEKKTDLEDLDEIEAMLQTFRQEEPELASLMDEILQEIPFPETFPMHEFSKRKSWLTRLAKWATQPSIPWIRSLPIQPVSFALILLPSILSSFILFLVLTMIEM